MNFKILSFALFTMTITFTSCKKGDTVNPTTIIHDTVAASVQKEGFIKATLTGKMTDTTSFSYSIINTGIGNNNFYNNKTSDNCTSTYQVNSSNSTTITIKKAYAGDGDKFEEGFIYLTFDVTSLTDLSTPINRHVDIYLSKKLDNTNLFNLIPLNDGERDYFGANTIYTNLLYDKTTSTITGSFSMSPKNDNTFVHYHSLSVTNGTFSTKLVKIVD